MWRGVEKALLCECFAGTGFEVAFQTGRMWRRVRRCTSEGDASSRTAPRPQAAAHHLSSKSPVSGISGHRPTLLLGHDDERQSEPGAGNTRNEPGITGLSTTKCRRDYRQDSAARSGARGINGGLPCLLALPPVRSGERFLTNWVDRRTGRVVGFRGTFHELN